MLAIDTRLEPIANAVHLCSDMQNIFARGGVWETPWMERVLPSIVALTERYAARTVFTRFITPQHVHDRPGRWRQYFEKWECATRAVLPASQLELIPELQRFVPPAHIMDKPAYSAFTRSHLMTFLVDKGITTLVLTGSETDVCVLATALNAVDLGFRVIIVEDALCSSFDAGHDALMTLYRCRFSQQIELFKTEELKSLWTDET